LVPTTEILEKVNTRPELYPGARNSKATFDPTLHVEEETPHLEDEPGKKKKQPSVSIFKLFRFATYTEILMILAAIVLSAGTGALQPVSIIILGQFIGTIGQHMISGDYAQLAQDSQPLVLIYVYMGTAILVAAYICNCFWVITGENQTRRIRQMYVHAILRQDMAWFDKAEEGSLNTRLAADTQLIQDGISEKFGLLVQGIGQFVAGFIVAFIKGWRLAGRLYARVMHTGTHYIHSYHIGYSSSHGWCRWCDGLLYNQIHS
jgi:ATP-binding cassette subfamily B (MDR/TAP) protein 1